MAGGTGRRPLTNKKEYSSTFSILKWSLIRFDTVLDAREYDLPAGEERECDELKSLQE